MTHRLTCTMTEAELQLAVEAKLRETGLLWHHCTRPETCRGSAGFPDLIVAGRAAWLAAELKSEDGRRSRAQIGWGIRAEQAGLAYLMARPSDTQLLTSLIKSLDL